MKAPLSKTLEDHVKVGGTPPNILVENPRKTHAELMSADEIRQNLIERIRGLKELRDMGLDTQQVYRRQVELYNLDVEYLEEIGRLPEGFEPLS